MFIQKSFFIMLAVVLLFGCAAFAESDAAITPEALELCLEAGRRRSIFPDETACDDLIIETYTIDAFGKPYSIWVVSTKKQRSDVEFGWLSIHAPTNTILQSSRTRQSYEDAIRMLDLEQTYGCNYFWPSALKAQYYHALRGEESRITFPNENEITEAEAIAIARKTLMEDLDLEESLLCQLPVSAEFYQDNTPNDSVQSERFWGITFRSNDSSLRFPPLYAVVIDGASGVPEYSIDYQKNLTIEHTKSLISSVEYEKMDS